jgi:hypothetical protein
MQVAVRLNWNSRIEPKGISARVGDSSIKATKESMQYEVEGSNKLAYLSGVAQPWPFPCHEATRYLHQ